jgi:hypothetical protein
MEKPKRIEPLNLPATRRALLPLSYGLGPKGARNTTICTAARASRDSASPDTGPSIGRRADARQLRLKSSVHVAASGDG